MPASPPEYHQDDDAVEPVTDVSFVTSTEIRD